MTKRTYVISFILMGCAVIQTSLMGDLHAQGKPEVLDEQSELVQDMKQKFISYAADFVFSAQALVTPMQAAQMDETPLEQAKELITQTHKSFEKVQAKLTHGSALGSLIAGLQAKLNASVPPLDACLTGSEQILGSLGSLAELKHDKVTTAFMGQMREHITQACKHFEDEKKLVPIDRKSVV